MRLELAGGMMELAQFPDLEALSRHAADELAALARDSPGPLHVALSGGSTPKRLFAQLAAMGRDAIPWERVHLWWGDERCVPADHADSNFGMAKRALLDPLRLEPARVHRIAAERDPIEAARDYERTLVGLLGTPPVLDLVWLGVGTDGHTASLFPGSSALVETARFVAANPIESPLVGGAATRITLTFPALNAARRVRFLVAGAEKAEVLARVAAGADLPCARVRGADVRWLVDDAAAARLDRSA